jgi:hypothetical protein
MPKDIVYAIRMKIASAIGGGYDQQARTLRSEVRRAVIERDQGRCVLCGGPGEEVDHIAGPSPELTNLRLLCKSCHRVVTEQHLIPITDAGARGAVPADLVPLDVAHAAAAV